MPIHQQGAVPLAYAEARQTLITNATQGQAWSSSYGTGNLGSALDVRDWREVTLELTVNPGAAADQIEVIALLSNQADPPAGIGTDTWFPPSVTDGTYTETTLVGTLPTGFDASQAYNRAVYRPLLIAFDAVAAGTEEQRMSVTVNVERARWCAIIAHNLAAADVAMTIYGSRSA